MLDPEVRIKVLRQLGSRAAMAAARKLLPKNATDPIQRAIDAFISGSLMVLKSDTLRDLSSLFQVVEWIRSAGYEESLPQRQGSSAGQHGQHYWSHSNTLPQTTGFAGVQRSWRNSASMLGAPPGSVVESLTQLVEAVLSFNQKKPLTVIGPGGVGKSTLIARFILEHARHSASDRFPWAYLDFDRPDVRADEPVTLLIEALRQLGVQYPEAQIACDNLAADLTVRRTRLEPRSGETVSRQHWDGFILDFAAFLRQGLNAGKRPLLFVLDTFEEVQTRSQTWALNVWRFLEQLQAAVPFLRTVLAGRAPVPEGDPLVLEGLDEEAGTAFSSITGSPTRRSPESWCGRRVGNPLTLRLAAHLAVRARQEGKAPDAELEGTGWFQLTDAQIQRYLYDRVLNDIKDPEVRAVAHPGLVLRELTPALILEVLAEPMQSGHQ